MKHPVGIQYRVTQKFLQEDEFTRRTYRSGVHFGTDFACPKGTPVVAPLDGTVVEIIRNNKTMGNAVRFECVKDGTLYSLRFLHNSLISCKLGPVKEGELLALSGNTGMGASFHVHLDIMKGHFVFDYLLSKDSIIANMVDPEKWCVPKVISEKFDPLDEFTTQMLIDELVTRPFYKQLLANKIKSL